MGSARSYWTDPASAPTRPSPTSQPPATAARSSTPSPPTGCKHDCSRVALPSVAAFGKTPVATAANTETTETIHLPARLAGDTGFRDRFSTTDRSGNIEPSTRL